MSIGRKTIEIGVPDYPPEFENAASEVTKLITDIIYSNDIVPDEDMIRIMRKTRKILDCVDLTVRQNL